MENNVFEEPVSIFTGLSFPTRIASVGEAHAVLTDWPAYQRGPAHAVALRACKAALVGEDNAETVRGTFARFAYSVGILLPEAGPLPLSSGSETGRHPQAKNVA
jgi:hypothetical protein